MSDEEELLNRASELGWKPTPIELVDAGQAHGYESEDHSTFLTKSELLELMQELVDEEELESRDFRGDMREFSINKLNDMVDEFAMAMKDKLKASHDRGKWGWDDEATIPVLKRNLMDNATKALINDDDSQWLDVANFCSFLWWHSLMRCELSDCKSVDNIARIDINEVVGDTTQKVGLCTECAERLNVKDGDTL